MAAGSTRRRGPSAFRRALKLGPVRLTVFTGPMQSGKSAMLISRLTQYTYANLDIHVFFPTADARGPAAAIASRLGINIAAHPVPTARAILEQVPPACDVVAIDEVQLFADPVDLVAVVRALLGRGIVVLAAGLDLDFAERPFPAVAALCALADLVEKLTAICSRCGSTFATRTQRLVDGVPAAAAGPAVLVEGVAAAVTYEARCAWCYEPPAQPGESGATAARSGHGHRSAKLEEGASPGSDR